LAFPRQALATRFDFLEADGVITVPGGVSILSLMTELIRRHCGPDRAAKSVHQLALTARTGVSAFDRGRAMTIRRVADARIQRAVVLIESRKGSEISPEDAARAAGLSKRQFTRLFRDNLGMTPKRFILDTRLRHARFLVENSVMSMTAIAFETGFADCAHLSTAFRARYGAPPRSLRTG
jgi:transcriptional regulator GlxA family with amidase domain